MSRTKVDRRLLPRRLLINPPVFVSLSESRTDLLFDLGEGGISVYGLVPNEKGEVIPIAFDLPGTGGSIEASAKIAWTSNSRNRTGLRFIHVTDTSRQRLKDWMAKVYTAGPSAGSDAAARATAPPVADIRDTPIPQAGKNENVVQLMSAPTVLSYHGGLIPRNPHGSTKPGRSSVAVGILAGVTLLALIFGVARRHLPKKTEPQKAGEITVPTVQESHPSSAVPKGAPSAEGSLTSRPPTGFVLQLAAMAHEQNADRFADSLKQRKLPAFVFRRKPDRLYTVFMGPYPDLSTANKAKDELQRANIDAIIRRWMPE